jgi:TolA-binding protein
MARSMGPGKKTVAATTTTKEEIPSYVCPHCGNLKKRTEFYVSSDPAVRIGVAFPCKVCAEKIARGYNEKTGKYGDVTETTLKNALCYLDKPFLNVLYEASYNEVHDASLERQKSNLWAAYIKNVQMRQYNTLRWRDSDFFQDNHVVVRSEDLSDNMPISANPEVWEEYQTNKRDIVRLVGYDPFANYPVEQDLPVLYAQLISFIDEETKNDGMKMNAVIQIVQSFNQIQKLNDAINELSSDTKKLNNNNGTIKQHADTISKLLSGANALAKDNGISVNHNNSKSKGQNTLTGKMKDLDLIGFRAAKINMYDIDYCKGMQQVANISAKAQVDQIGFDENVMVEIGNIRRELVDELQKAKDKAEERARVLLVENKDLKEFLKEKGLIDESGQVIDDG